MQPCIVYWRITAKLGSLLVQNNLKKKRNPPTLHREAAGAISEEAIVWQQKELECTSQMNLSKKLLSSMIHIGTNYHKVRSLSCPGCMCSSIWYHLKLSARTERTSSPSGGAQHCHCMLLTVNGWISKDWCDGTAGFQQGEETAFKPAYWFWFLTPN